MKRTLLLSFLALWVSAGMSSTATALAPAAPVAECPAPEAAAPSIIGKWRVTDLKFQVPAGQKQPNQADVRAMVQKQNMAYEFHADGTMTVTADGREPETLTYKKVGNKCTTIDKKGHKEVVEIATLTEKEMTMRLGKEKMTFTLQKEL